MVSKAWRAAVLAACVCIGACIVGPEAVKTDGMRNGGEVSSGENPFGVLEFLYWNHGWNNHQYPDMAAVDRSVRLMRDAHVGMVRMDILWQDIEAVKGTFDFSKYDAIVQRLTDNGIGVFAVLSYHTDWASPNGKWNMVNADHGMFLNYCRAVVNRYKGKISYWEIWNEPDSGIYWEPQDGLKHYCALLREAYRVIKTEDPSSFVLNGGLAMGLSSVNKLYDNGAKDSFDIMNIHDFQTPEDPIAVKRLSGLVNGTYKVMCRNGDGNKKIWVTETGCPGVKPVAPVVAWWMGKNPTEDQQAGFVKETYRALLACPPVEKVFWAFFRDTDRHWNNGVDFLGLIRHDFSPKPALKAYKEAFQEWLERRVAR